MAVSIPHCVVKKDRLSLDEDRLQGDFYYEALAFSRHNINLELDEEIITCALASNDPTISYRKHMLSAHEISASRDGHAFGLHLA